MTPARLLLVLWLCAAGVLAQEPAASHPGFFELDDLEIVDADGSSVDINLSGSMLRLVGAAVLQEEPELGQLVSQMHSLRVVVAPLEDVDTDGARAGIAKGVARLEGSGWQRVVRVKEDGEQVHVYLKEIEGQIEGLTLFVAEASELTMINIAGRLDVELLGALGRAFDVPTLEEALAEMPPLPSPPKAQPKEKE